MKIWFRVHGFEECSWTYVWEGLRKGFTDIGVTVYILDGPEVSEDCIELWWGDPQYWSWSELKVKLRVALALSEAESFLFRGRKETIANLQKSDLIISPSESATRAIRESPIDVPIKVAFFGVDPDEFRYLERTIDPALPIRFLHAGVTQFRKGSWLIPEAFIEAFGGTNDAALTIASPRATPMFTKLKNEYSHARNINFHSKLEESTMALYENHHVYVSPHLAEGFALMLPEAMAAGMACLVSRVSAPLEFFSDKYGWWIEMSEDYVPVDGCLPDTAGFWRLPDVKSLAKVMRQVVDNPETTLAKGKLAAQYVKDNLTWKHTATKIVSLIKEHLNEENIGNNTCV